MSDESSAPEPSPESGLAPGVVRGPTDVRWLDRSENINRIIMALVAACVASVAADFFFHKHVDYSFQAWLGFDAVFGFVAYVGLITVAKGVRRLLMRSEDYYD
jgi:hypothetical protein